MPSLRPGECAILLRNVPTELRNHFSSQARLRGKSMNGLIRNFMEYYISKRGRMPPDFPRTGAPKFVRETVARKKS